jgi:DNA processing protein
MSTLSGFWHGAAKLTGRIDLSAAVHAHPGGIEALGRSRLSALGVAPVHAAQVLRAEPLEILSDRLTLDDPAYPDVLAPLPFAPPVLFCRGNTNLLSAPVRVAIVGARRCTEDGRRMARELASGVADAGGVVISGLAYGIDAAAHLAAPSRTIAVLGCGLGCTLARTRGRVARTILDAGGLILSEFVPDLPASKRTFPQRNRVIAGLSQATVVVEASRRSGARITARHALEAGREVLAVPGSPYAPTSAGCLDLLADGAGLVRGLDDILDRLGIARRPAASADHPVLAAMNGTSARFDDLVDRCALAPATLMRTLSMLELTGRVVRLPGDRYAEKR